MVLWIRVWRKIYGRKKVGKQNREHIFEVSPSLQIRSSTGTWWSSNWTSFMLVLLWVEIASFFALATKTLGVYFLLHFHCCHAWLLVKISRKKYLFVSMKYFIFCFLPNKIVIAKKTCETEIAPLLSILWPYFSSKLVFDIGSAKMPKKLSCSIENVSNSSTMKLEWLRRRGLKRKKSPKNTNLWPAL